MSDMEQFIETVQVITCGRCKAGGTAYASSAYGASDEFAERGWNVQRGWGTFGLCRVLCPECVSDLRPIRSATPQGEGEP